ANATAEAVGELLQEREALGAAHSTSPGHDQVGVDEVHRAGVGRREPEVAELWRNWSQGHVERTYLHGLRAPRRAGADRVGLEREQKRRTTGPLDLVDPTGVDGARHADLIAGELKVDARGVESAAELLGDARTEIGPEDPAREEHGAWTAGADGFGDHRGEALGMVGLELGMLDD